MTTTLTLPTGFGSATHRAFADSRREPDWLADRRQFTFAQYLQKLDAPLSQEEWKRVELRMFKPGQFALRGTADRAAQSFATLMHERTNFAGAVTHLDGGCSLAKLDDSLAKRGVLFGNLTDLLVTHRDTLEPHFARAVRPETDRFSAWHAAYWTGGTVLYVPQNIEIKEPLYSLIGLAEPNAADFSHTLVILEDGASATLLEETSSANTDAAGLHVGAVELIVGKGASLRYVQLQNWNQHVWHFAHQTGLVAADASLQWTVAGVGARTAHIHQEVKLQGRGASGEVNGATFATDRQLLSYFTQQTHQAENTRSDLLYKDVLRDQARVVWRGMIRVDSVAQKTDGYQRNDSLLLSPDARADAIPGLEILADDVRCTHGATAGRVDEEQIFYSMSRGLSRREAMHMIVEGFFHGVYDRIAIDAVRETLSQAVKNKLGLGL